MIITSNFQKLVEPRHRMIFFNSLTSVPMTYKQLFKSENMRLSYESYPHLGGFGLWEENTEGSTINEDTMVEGPTAYMYPKRYDKGYRISREMMKDDYYGVFVKGKGVNGSAHGMGEQLNKTIELSAMSVLEDGFSNVGYDGKALFANDHPIPGKTVTSDNLVTGAMSPETIKEAITLLRRQLKDDGTKAVMTPTVLWYADENEWLAAEIMKATRGEAYTGDNTPNVIPRMRLLCLPYLGENNGSRSLWGVADKASVNIRLDWREMPDFSVTQLEKTVDLWAQGYARWAIGYTDWRGIVGSQG